MSPASNYHGVLQGRLCQRLIVLGGQALVEASVVTVAGLLVADVAWCCAEFICNSVRELREKVDAYLAAGGVEAWIAYRQTKRFEFFGKAGHVGALELRRDLSHLFD
jgi:hypothetical protein